MVECKDGPRPRRHIRFVVGCLLAVATLATLAALVGSESDGTATAADAPPPEQVVTVEHVKADRWAYARARFNEMCAGCHSLRSAGATGPRYDLDRAGGYTEERVRFAVAEGEPGMPAWRGVLSYREYEELVAFISTTADSDLGGETNWGWQIRLREAGEVWKPEDPR